MTVEHQKAILKYLEETYNIQYITDVGHATNQDGWDTPQWVGVIDGDGVLIQIEDDGYVSVGNAKKDYVERYFRDEFRK